MSGTISSSVTAPAVKSRTAFISETGTPLVFHWEMAAGVFLKWAASAAERPFSSSSHFVRFMVHSLAFSKPFRQALPKPDLFSIGFMKNTRRSRLVAYFNGPAMKGSRELLINRSGLTKGRIAQFFDEKQPFGELAARGLARRLDLVEDFFERDYEASKAPEMIAPPSGARAELLKLFEMLPPYDQAAVLKDAHDRAARVLGDKILSETFGVTGYAGDSSLPPIYSELERRRINRETGQELQPSPLNLRGQDEKDDGQEHQA